MRAIPDSSLSEQTRRSRLSAAWRHALPLWLAVAGWIVFWYRDTVATMWHVWMENQTYAHGLLVVPIAAWLVWRMRHQLEVIVPAPEPLVLPFVAAVTIVWLVADVAAVNAATQFALVGLIVLSVPAVLGMPVARVIAFPLGFLFFAVPFGDFLLQPMMMWTAHVTVWGVRLSGVPIYLEGLQLVVPTGTWTVVEGCSGLRYLVASVMTGTLFAYLTYRSNARRVAFVAGITLLAFVANWMRAYLVVMIGHLSNNTIDIGFDHIVFGWLFFGAIIFVAFVVGRRWSDTDGNLPGELPAPAGATASGRRGVWAGILALSVVVLLPHVVTAALVESDRDVTLSLVAPVELNDEWRAADAGTLPEWRPAFANPTAQTHAVYGRGVGSVVGVDLIYYRTQRPDGKLVSSGNALVRSDDDVWTLARSARLTTVLGSDAVPVVFRTAELRASKSPTVAGAPRLQVWQTYWINGRWVENDAMAKLYLAVDRLIGRGGDGAVVIVYAATDEPGANEQDLRQFVEQNLGRLDTALRGVRKSVVSTSAAPANSATVTSHTAVVHMGSS